MAVLQECPICNHKQSIKNKKCRCGQNLDTVKKQGKTRYWIQYRIPNGHTVKEGKRVAKYKQRKEFVGTSLEDAKAADGKRKTQKKEGRIFDMVPESKTTFNELTEWYLSLTSIQQLNYYQTIVYNLNSFNSVFGDVMIKDVSAEELREYQIMRKSKGLSDSYIDQQVGAAHTMLNRAFEGEKIGGDSLKPFKLVKRLLKSGKSNARDRILSPEEYVAMMEHLPRHIKPIFAMGYHTGMRRKEILTLTWNQVNLIKRIITLEADQTKDKEKRYIPINDDLLDILNDIPRGIHDDHLFLYRGAPIRDIRRGLQDACKKAGIPYGRKVPGGFTFHDLRHTFNTNMRKAGVPESVIMEITGHASRTMFDRYNTVDQEDMKVAVEKMQSFLSDVTQNVTQGKREGIK